MDDTFYDRHDELYQHAKFGEDRTTRAGVGAKMWCFYRQDAAKWQTAGIRFTHRPKIRLVAPIQVKLCRTDGHLGPLGRVKFHNNRRRGMGMRPQNIKNFHFLVESPRRGDSLDRFPKFFRGFYTSNYPTLVFQISCDSHHRLRSYC